MACTMSCDSPAFCHFRTVYFHCSFPFSLHACLPVLCDSSESVQVIFNSTRLQYNVYRFKSHIISPTVLPACCMFTCDTLTFVSQLDISLGLLLLLSIRCVYIHMCPSESTAPWSWRSTLAFSTKSAICRLMERKVERRIQPCHELDTSISEPYRSTTLYYASRQVVFFPTQATEEPQSKVHKALC